MAGVGRIAVVLVLLLTQVRGHEVEEYEGLRPLPEFPESIILPRAAEESDPIALVPRAVVESEFSISGSGVFSGSGDVLSPTDTVSTLAPNFDSTIFLRLTFTDLSLQQFQEDGLQEHISNLLDRLLNLDSSPSLMFSESSQSSGSVVLVYFPSNISVATLESYAFVLMHTNDSAWMNLLDKYGLIDVTVGVVATTMPWWHWFLIALVGVLAASAYILMFVAFCCRCASKKNNASKVSYKKWDTPRDNIPLQEVSKIQEKSRQMQDSRQQLVRKVSRVSFQSRSHTHLYSHPLPIKDLKWAVANPDAILSEYATIPSNMVTMAEVPAGAEEKNRYRDVLPNPQTRVPLFLKFGVANSDYINANYIRGYKNSSKYYIATQGPLLWTVADFWRMIWEQRCSTIIMTTKLEEKGMAKCVQYWPEERHSHSAVYEDLEIHLRRRVITKNYSTTTLLLQHKDKMVSREVTQFWYTSWPDHGVPASAQTVVEFLLHVQKHTSADMPGPVVVHCSAGIGRTGVFIAADIGMQQLHNEGEVDTLRILSSLRQDRGGMIQTKEQYVFLHQVLLEYVTTCGVQSTIKNLGQLEPTPEEDEDT